MNTQNFAPTPIYDSYAPRYDSSGHVHFAMLMAYYLQDVLVQHPTAGRRALDVACGTGTLATILAEQGWDVVGVDSSASMLQIARAKAANLETTGRAAFALGDMRALWQRDRGETIGVAPDVEPESFDIATCTYDSLNYLLTEAELARCFAGMAQALRPGGVCIIDMNTRHFLEHEWGTCDVTEGPGFVQVMQSSFDAATACSTMQLIWFTGDDEHGYQRHAETHVERAYPTATVNQLLERAALHIEAVYDCFTLQPPHERSQRLCWVARKR